MEQCRQMKKLILYSFLLVLNYISATTIKVGGDNKIKTISAALVAAKDGDTILIN